MSNVYFTKKITNENIVRIYKMLEKEFTYETLKEIKAEDVITAMHKTKVIVNAIKEVIINRMCFKLNIYLTCTNFRPNMSNKII